MFKRKKLSRGKSRKMFNRATRSHPKNMLFTGIASSGMRGGVRF